MSKIFGPRGLRRLFGPSLGRRGGGFSPDSIPDDLPLFTLDSALTFQDRSTTPETVAGIGDPVGCVVGMGGRWFIIPPSDEARPVLRADATGTRYLETTSGVSILPVVDADGNPFLMGTAHSAVWAGAGFGDNDAPYAANTGANRPTPELVQSGSTWRLANANADGQKDRIVISGPVPMDQPHLAWFRTSSEKSFARMNGQTGTRDQPPFPITPGALAIASASNVVASETPARIYAFAAMPRTSSEAYIESLRQYLTAIMPGSAAPASSDPVLLDFESSHFNWGGVDRALGDLASNGGGSYTLNYADWWSSRFTIFVDTYVPEGESPNADLVTFDTVNDDGLVIFCESAAAKYRQTGDIRSGIRPNKDRRGQSTPILMHGLHRIGVRIEPEEFAKLGLDNKFTNGEDGFAVGSLAARTESYTDPVTSVTVETGIANCEVRRVKIVPGAITDSEFYAEMRDGIAPPIHWLTDSFGAGGKMEQATQQFIQTLGYVAGSTDFDGGSTLTEQLVRYQTYDRWYASTLISVDGVIETTQTIEDVLDAIDGMRALLDGHDRFLYIQPNPLNAVGDSRREEWELYMSAIKSHIGDAFIPALTAMQTAHDDTAQDLIDVSVGRWPSSLTIDGTHPEGPGTVRYGFIQAGALFRAGYVPTGTELIDTMQDFSSSGASFAEGAWVHIPPASVFQIQDREIAVDVDTDYLVSATVFVPGSGTMAFRVYIAEGDSVFRDLTAGAERRVLFPVTSGLLTTGTLKGLTLRAFNPIEGFEVRDLSVVPRGDHTPWLPDAPADFTKTGLDLSWSLPSDEGNDPVRSFTVSVEDSPGAGTFTEVYTGQLRRHTLTGLTSGTWKARVVATNEVGTGPHAEIEVVVS